jgi:hypothetical protein
MRGRIVISFSALLVVCLACRAYGETVYFLVGEKTAVHDDSYVLPLSEGDDIAYARNLVSGGMAFATCVVADIAATADCINRNYVSPFKAPWSWHVTDFVAFVEVPAPGLDGWPGFVQNVLAGWMSATGGRIGFSNYTVVAELGTDPNHWMCDFFHDDRIDSKDFARLGEHWGLNDCNYPGWCNGTDLDKSGTVDNSDLKIFVGSWLSPFADEPMHYCPYDCWMFNARHCHGDADGLQEYGPFWVGLADLSILQACYPLPVRYGEPRYNPCADFDKDADVDNDDETILNRWFYVANVPADCADCPHEIP